MFNKKTQKLVFYLVFTISVFLLGEQGIEESHALSQSQIFELIIPEPSRGSIVAEPISSEHLSTIQNQINRGHLDVNATFKKKGINGTLLSWAALGCQVELVRFLLGKENLKLDELDLSWNDSQGKNMLHFVSVSLGFKNCNQRLQSQCNLLDLISVSNPLSSINESETSKNTNHQNSQNSENIELNQSSPNDAEKEETVINLKNSTRSSEILCLLLNAKLQNIKKTSVPAQEALKNWVNQQEQGHGKTPGHIASEYVGAYLSQRIIQGNRVNIEEIKESLNLSEPFFSLLRIIGADFHNLQASMQVGGSYSMKLMSVNEKIQDVSRMFANYDELQAQIESLTEVHQGSIMSKMEMSLFSSLRSSANGFSGLGKWSIDLGFQCSASGCLFGVSNQSGRTTNTVYPFHYFNNIRESSEEEWNNDEDFFNILERIDEHGEVKPPPIKCAARGQGGGPFVALGYTCHEAKKFAIWRCRFPSRYHPSSCYITGCIGTDPNHPILCDSKFEYGEEKK